MEKSKLINLLVSFLLAGFLWIYSTAESDPMVYQRIDNIPLNYINTEEFEAKGLAVTTTSETSVSIRVYGRSGAIDRIKTYGITADLDFSSITSVGEYSVPVTINGVSSSIAIIDTSPKKIDITVDTLGESSINTPIITASDKPKDPYAVVSITPQISNVSIKGGQSKVDEVKQIVGKISVSGRSADFTGEVSLMAVDKNGKVVSGVSLSPKTIKVDVVIGISKQVSVSVQTSGSVADGYYLGSVTPSSASITILGKEDVINQISKIYTQPIDLSDVSESFNASVGLLLPQGVVTLGGSKSVNVRVVIDSNNEKSFWIQSFTFVGLDNSLAAVVLDDDVRVILTGNQETLDGIAEASMSGSIDVTGLGEGTHNVSLTIQTGQLPSGVTIKSVSSQAVQVKITKK